MNSMDRWMAQHERRELRYARTRRKLAAALADVERRIDAVRRHNHCPEHAPTACRLMNQALRPLYAERNDLERRAMAVELAAD